MNEQEAIQFLEMIRGQGDYKVEIHAYSKDSIWTIKAYHRDGYSKSCTTSGKTLLETIRLAREKFISKNTEQKA